MSIQIEEEEIVKILSIEANQLPIDVREWVKWEYTYRDMVLKEHLYPVELLEDMDKQQLEALPEKVISTIQEIEVLCNQYGASYWRIIQW